MNLTVKQFAESLSITPQAVVNAVKTGRVKLTDDDTIDPSDDVNLAYKDRIARRKKTHDDSTRGGPGKQKRKDQTVVEYFGEQQREVSDIDNVDVYNLGQVELQRLQLIEKIRRDQVYTAEKRKELIDRDTVVRLFKKIYAIDTNELLVACHRIAPAVAAIFGSEDPGQINKVEQLLQDDTYKTLGHIKSEINKFLKKQKAKVLN